MKYVLNKPPINPLHVSNGMMLSLPLKWKAPVDNLAKTGFMPNRRPPEFVNIQPNSKKRTHSEYASSAVERAAKRPKTESS